MERLVTDMTETEILFDLLEKGISPAHAVSACEKRLTDAGFEVVDYGMAWNLKAGGKYVINHHETTLFAFTLPQNWSDREPAIRIAAAHTDFPCLRIKPSCDIQTNGYAQVNVEVYGGAILNTWLDRPLGVAGRVAVRSGDVFTPKVVTFQSEKNLMTIPNLAIHMNREVNKGVELNKQTELLPICGLSDDADYFLDFLVKELAVKKEDILDFELTIYNKEKPEFVDISSKNYDKEFTVTDASVVERIYSAFGQEPWYCIRIGKVGFSGDILEDAFEYYNSIVSKQQRMIERAFQKIFEHWYEPVNPSNDFSVQPLKYVRNATVSNNNG